MSRNGLATGWAVRPMSVKREAIGAVDAGEVAQTDLSPTT